MPARPCCQPIASLPEPDPFRALGDPSRAAPLLHLAGADGDRIRMPQIVTVRFMR